MLTVAALGWLFDCLDQQLFLLARPAAMESLIPEVHERPTKRKSTGSSGVYATWPPQFSLPAGRCGGLFFGVLGDRIGRAKTMMLTILLYSIFTGVERHFHFCLGFHPVSFSDGPGCRWRICCRRGARGRSHAHFRPYTVADTVTGSDDGGQRQRRLDQLGPGNRQEHGLEGSPWRIMFVIGALPRSARFAHPQPTSGAGSLAKGSRMMKPFKSSSAPIVSCSARRCCANMRCWDWSLAVRASSACGRSAFSPWT